MKNEFRDYLDDITKSMEYALSFTSGMTRKLSTQSSDAFEVIGEAVKRIPEDFRELHPVIPWKAMAGMRDRLNHGYEFEDNEIIWITVKGTILSILEKISQLIDELVPYLSLLQAFVIVSINSVLTIDFRPWPSLDSV